MSNVRLTAKIRHLGETAMPWGSAGRAATMPITTWHYPYNKKKTRINTQSVQSKTASCATFIM